MHEAPDDAPDSTEGVEDLLSVAGPLLLWVADDQGRRNWFGPRWLEFRGRRLEDERGDGWLEGVHPEDRDRCLEARRATVDDRTDATVEYRLRRHDGTYRRMLERSAPLLDAQDRITHVVGACTDITLRRELAERVAYEARYRALAEATATLVFSLDGDGRVVTRQQQWERFTGQRWPDYEAYGFLDAVHPDDREGVADSRGALREGSGYRMVFRIHHAPSNSWRHCEIRAAPLHDPAGRISEWIGTLTDIEDRWRIEQALVESERTEMEARAAAERSNRRLDLLLRISDVLRQDLDVEQLLRDVAAESVPVVADAVTVHLDGPAGLQLVAVGGTDLGRSHVEVDAGDQPFVTQALQSAQPVVASLVGDDDTHRPLIEAGYGTVAAFPLSAHGRTFGVIQFLITADRPVASADLDLAADVASRAASAADYARLHGEQRRVAETFQRSLLPASLPSIPGVEVAVRYWPAATTANVGGDFYDLFPVADGTWGLLVGDVCGKGTEAAALTGVARHTLRAAACHTTDPCEALTWVQEALSRQDVPTFCTACFGLLERAGALGRFRFRFCLGGHPPLVVARADGSHHAVGSFGTVLGLVEEVHLVESTVELGTGDVMLLYTDGLTDVPGARGYSIPELGTTVAEMADRTPDDIADALGEGLRARTPGGSADDTALVVLKVLG